MYNCNYIKHSLSCLKKITNIYCCEQLDLFKVQRWENMANVQEVLRALVIFDVELRWQCQHNT